MITRRFLVGSILSLPILAGLARPARALSTEDMPKGVSGVSHGGLWDILVHATDGTDSSTMVVTELARVTPDIRALAGKEIELTGYLQPVAGAFGRTEYILSRAPFHCPGCYPSGRAGLALVKPAGTGHVVADQKPVTVKGVLSLNETVPDDFYFILSGARFRA